MNFKEAVSALYEGKKIRRPDWGCSNYWYMENGVVFDNAGRKKDFIGVEGEWELYKQKTLNAEQIFEVLKRGGKIKQKTWGNDTYHYQLYEGDLWEFRTGVPFRRVNELYVLIDTWIEVK